MKKGDLRREQILDTAEKLFYEQGYDRTGVQDILDALHMSKGGFYHYFEAKEQLLQEICKRRWKARFDALGVELNDARLSPMDKLNRVLALTNLFEAEDAAFAALMLKVCYQDGDASILDCRRRTLIDGLAGHVERAFMEGVQSGALHARHPMDAARLILLLACDINDEACGMLADQPDSPDVMFRLIERLNAYREAIELLAGAPFGSMTVFEPGRLAAAWQSALKRLSDLEEEK